MAERKILLSSLKGNPGNPRTIKDPKFQQLMKNLKEFPKMMELRGIVIDKTSKVLAGNMRRLALEKLGYTEIPASWVKKATDFTEEERARFIVLDNDHAGQWDYEALANGWDMKDLNDWGLTMPDLNDKNPVSFNARKVKKGCKIIVICKDEEITQEVFARLLKEGHEVEVK